MRPKVITPSKSANRYLRLQMLANDPFCYWCKKRGIQKLLNINNSNIDHVLPKSKMPKGTRIKKVLSCIECNTAKADMWPKQFEKAQGS